MKEKRIIEWFEAWFNPKWNNFETIFDKDIYYSESWGPEYHGVEQIKKWFHEWHKHSKLNTWEIKQFKHMDSITLVEWSFSCFDNEEIHEFDGVSLIEWNQVMQIKSLKEYGSSQPKYNPYNESKIIKPKRLFPGDKVAIISLSSGLLGEKNFIHKYTLAKTRLETYGFKVVATTNALKGIDYLYAHPEARAQDLMEAFKNPEIKAIFNAIGGDDTIRLLPYIDFEVIKNNPKIFTGFSDTTTNHFMMYKAGIVSYYGLSVMNNLAEYVAMNEYTKDMFENTLLYPQKTLNIPCSDYCSYEKDKIWWDEKNLNKPTPRFVNSGYEIIQGTGKVTGELLGGCIDVFIELMGTSLWPTIESWRGKILLIETSEVDMHEILLLEILRNLAAQGIINVINGIVVGKPAFEDKIEKYKAVYKQAIGFEAKRPDLPILYNVNVGHAYPIGLFPLGLKYEIDCDNKTFTLLEPATK